MARSILWFALLGIIMGAFALSSARTDTIPLKSPTKISEDPKAEEHARSSSVNAELRNYISYWRNPRYYDYSDYYRPYYYSPPQQQQSQSASNYNDGSEYASILGK